MVNTNYILWAR